MSGRRAGHTLLELLVALALLGLVLAIVVGTTTRTWRAHRDHGARAEARAQLEAGLFALASDLRPLSALAGDLVAGEARDTSIEIRALVVTGALCDTSGGRLAMQPVTAPDDPGRPAVPETGDIAWGWVDDSTGGQWYGAAVTSARRAATVAGRCARDGTAIELVLSGGAWPRVLGAPVRVTRRARWSSYRATDGWYLGRREWSASRLRFDVVQPVAGPLAPPGAAAGLDLRHLDAAGTELVPGRTAAERIARLEVTMRASGPTGTVRDSGRVVIALGRGEGAP